MQPSSNGSHIPRGLSIVNKTRRTLPGPQLLHELISTQTKDCLIIDFLQADGQRIKLGYDEFHQMTELLSCDIRKHLPKEPNRRCIIPVIIPQCPELYIAWVAVLKAGAAFCPVAHDVPAERLKFILQDVEATFVLATTTTSSTFADILSNIKCTTVALRGAQESLRSVQMDDLDSQPYRPIDPSSPAYVMYTSGSTGRPKGVMVSHLSVSQSLLAHDEHIPRFKRFLQFASPTFDVSIFEVLFPFFRGATLVGCEREHMLANLPHAIRTLNADAAELTPTVAGTLLRTRQAAPCLQVLLTIGEMLTSPVISEFGASPEKPSMLYAMYGPTEAAIHCTVASNLAADSSVRRIGRPLATVTAFILREGESQEIAPIGEPGELAIAGQLADGYLHRPEQNQAAFVQLPGYGSIYKTGDRALCHEDGELEILGRMISGQVKLRGQRVELGEIEEIASNVRGVQVAIASIIEDVLVLFCVAGRSVTARQVSAKCKSWLPPYMRPSEIIFIEDIPRLLSGKVDRKTLERVYLDQRATDTSDITFDDSVEEHLAQALSAELGVKIGRNTSLWSLGVDSLRAIKLASQLSQKYSSMNAAVLSEADNIAELATLLTRKTAPVEDLNGEAGYETSEAWQVVKAQVLQDPHLALSKSNLEKIVPCSSMQVAMLIETATNPTLNFNDIWLKVAPGLTLATIRQALTTLSQKNEILRSGFVSTSNKEMPFVQVVWRQLADTDLSLLHPLQMQKSEKDTETELHVRIHHALYDGWSWDLIVDDLNAILSGQAGSKRTQFSALISIEKRQVQLDVPRDLEYWRGLLQDFKPSCFPHLSATGSKRRGRVTAEIPLSFSYEHLSHVTSALRCSRETVLESAWSLTLSSYVDETDIAMGVVSAGRRLSLPGIDSVIGPCLFIFPLRIDIKAVRTAHDLINHIQRQRSQCIRYGKVTLRDINNAAGLCPADKLFDTLCVWQQNSEGHNRDRSKVMTIKTHDALDYAIVLEFEPRHGKIFVKLTFDSDRIPECHAEILMRQLDHVATRLMSDVKLRLESSWQESPKSLMSVSNASFENFSECFDLTSTISRLALTCPERKAIEFVHDINARTGRVAKDTLTYGELFESASTVSASLQMQYNVQTDDLVCLIGPRSICLYIGILGTIMAGAAYVCIDSRTPAERTRQILREARSRLILTTEDAHTPSNTTQISVCISDMLKHHPKGTVPPRTALTGDELAYAVFTSGSTGTPKGVLLTRRNLLSNLEVLSRIYPCEPHKDRLLQACSPAFDVSVFEIFWSWHMGMTLCTASNDILFRDLEVFIDKLEVTHLSMTPSVAALVSPDNVKAVKMLVTAGEPMNSKLFASWADRGLYQGYGPSETTNICNVQARVSKTDIQNNVGSPLPNTSVFICERQSPEARDASEGIVDEASLVFKLAPIGAVGEIWIGGEQVGRGYIDPALTTRSFYNHPEYGRLYRSGDIGRLLCDGSLVILGREDDQVKLRGQRIELGEINSALIRCEAIQDAVSVVTTGKAEPTGGLIAFWTSRKPTRSLSLSAANVAIYDQLVHRLPHYMIPDALIRIDKIPLTRQGKVSRRDLIVIYENLDANQRLTASRGNVGSEKRVEYSKEERIIAQTLASVLGVDAKKITRTSSFYALGLDSICAIHVARALRDQFPALEVSTLLRNPSIGQLSRSINTENPKKVTQKQMHTPGRCFPHALEKQIRRAYFQVDLEVEKLLPCTPLQESMASSSMHASSPAYQNTLRFEIHGNIMRLREAWEHVLLRHQILRTGFVMTDSADHPCVQVVLKNFQLPWIAGSNRFTKYGDLEYLMNPPWSIRVRRKHRYCELILMMHHCLYDAEAMAVLLREVEASYQGYQLPPPVSFDRYITLMEESDTDETYQFWREQFVGAPLHKLSDSIPPGDKGASGNNIIVDYRATLSKSEFSHFMRKSAATPLALVQAAWSRLLSCIFSSPDICFGNVLSGRSLPIDGVDCIVAPCFNTVPMRVRLRRDESNQELCHGLQQMNVDILPYQSSSVRRIQREVATQGRALYDTLLLLQNQEVKLEPDIWTLLEETGDMSFPFILEIVMDTKGDFILLRLHSEVAKKEFLGQLLEAFDALLVHTIRYPQARALDYSSATPLLPRLQLYPKLSFCGPLGEVNGSIHVDEELSGTEMTVKDVLKQLKPDIHWKVGKHTTIFHLGFDSINAVQIAARLRKQGFAVSSGDILEAADVGNIATLCESSTFRTEARMCFDLDAYDKEHRQPICLGSPIDEARVQSVWPCSPTQSGILLQFLKSDGRLYFNHMYFKLEAEVDLSRLRHAWSAAVEKHEMLRTGFVEMDEPAAPFAMIIYRPNAVQLPWFDSAIDKIDHMRELKDPPWHIQLSTAGSSLTLKLSMLHALYDAHSFDTILNDVGCIYRNFLPLIPVPLAPAISNILAMSRDENSKTFWSGFLTDMCPTRFPDMRIYNNNSNKYTVTTHRCSMPNTILEKACANAGVSMQALVAAAWAVLLSTYTDQDRVTFGIILSGRDLDADENEVVFPCINTVPFAVKVMPNKQELLSLVTSRCASVLKHQHTPLNLVRRWAQIEGDLFDTVVVLQKYNSHHRAKRPWTLIEEDATAEYTVSMELSPRENNTVVLQLTSQENVVPPGQARIILAQYEAIIESLIMQKDDNPKLPESMLSVVPAKDEQIPTDVRALHGFVELTANRNPEGIALEFVSNLKDTALTKQTWTYQQLDTNGNRIGRLLQSMGADVGELVAVCFEKCPEASFAILGVLKAGCGYLAIDPGAPPARKKFILQDSGCKLVLATEEQVRDFTSIQGITLVAVDSGEWQKLPPTKPLLARPLEPQDTCYCLYTSGTTGTPKGCLISHDSAVQAMLFFQRAFHGRWNSSSRWLQFASFHFDVSVLEQYWSWSVGICVTSAPRDLLFVDLPRTINALEITHLDLTPSLARLLTPEIVPRLCNGVFIVGGEQVRQDILEAWGDTGCLYNFYGPSEVTIGCTVHRQVPMNAKPTNIGQQWDNVGSFILEPHSQNPTLRGAVGELCLAGPLVGKGYLNRPELTKEKFVTLVDYDTRVYRTGDLVRLLHDNSFEFLGRLDNQVKLRGQRLEIGEINHVSVSADSSIQDVVTMVLKHPTQQKDHIVTFFTCAQRRSKNEKPSIMSNEDTRILASKIRKVCLERLPAYMVPTYILTVSSLALIG